MVSPIDNVVSRKKMLRQTVRGIYDLQKLRIQLGNRIAANFYAKAGKDGGDMGRTLSDSDKAKMAEYLRDVVIPEYRRITDALAEARTHRIPLAIEREGTGVITDETEYRLVLMYQDILKQEQDMFRMLGHTLEGFRIYSGYLKGVKGVGPATAGVLISELDPTKAPTASAFWKYAGLDVAADGKGRSRRAEHLIEVEYVDKSGEKQKRMSITFNPFLKTKLIAVLGPSLLRARNPRYVDRYQAHKAKVAATSLSPGHAHNRAIRYMVKAFLVDFWIEWRSLEGLPTPRGPNCVG